MNKRKFIVQIFYLKQLKGPIKTNNIQIHIPWVIQTCSKFYISNIYQLGI